MRSFLSKCLSIDRCKVGALLFALFWNCAVYVFTKPLTANAVHHYMGTFIDDMIPLIPASMVVYLGCYAFWGINYFLGCLDEEERVWKLFAADFLAKAVCLVFFVLMPTEMIRPEINGEGFFLKLTSLIYWIDSPVNLFPSIHCLVSWFGYIAVRKNKCVKPGYRWFSLVFALLVFVCTLTTKQHVIVDVFAGWLLAELCYYAAGKTGFSKLYYRCFRFLRRKGVD